jgi:hypothetical protein
MLRLGLRIALALHQINPALPQVSARDYASIVLAQAKAHALDPWLIVELVHRETHWIPSLVRHEHDGSCSVGAGQINGPCTRAFIDAMLEPHANLVRTAAVLGHLRQTCRKDCGEMGWLRGYNPGDATYGPAIVAAVRARHQVRSP